MNVVVTGGAGFIGSHVVERLFYDAPSEVIAGRTFDVGEENQAVLELAETVKAVIACRRGPNGHTQGSVPACEEQAKRILSLPIHQHLQADAIEYVASCSRSYYGN